MGRWYNGRWAERGCDGWLLRRGSGGEVQLAIGGALVGWVGRGSNGEVQWAIGGALVGWVGTVDDGWGACGMGGARMYG